MNPELIHHLRALTRMIYVVTEEEDKFIVDFNDMMKKHEARTWVYNAAFGLQPIANIRKDWASRAHTVSNDLAPIHDTLIHIYKDDPKENEHFYLITDPERWLKDEHVQRRLLNIVHQLHQDVRVVKCLIFVGSRKYIPEKLSRYMEVINDRGLSPEEIVAEVSKLSKQLRTTEPTNPAQLFRGMTSYEIEQAITQSVVKTKKDAVNPRRVDPAFVSDYKRKQLQKTDLISYVDTSDFKIESVGGLQRFKDWATQTKACWTPEGQKFGLIPPRGVLLMGVYGCGKSLSTKALAHLWGLPLITLEIGRLMSSGVGDSENNLYRALRLIEGVAPCVVWIDEAEKSLSGSQSSSRSDAGTTSRVLGILSTWVQETKAPVSLAMTANTLKTLPVEMVNRMDERFFFDLPSEEDCIDILKIHIAKVGQSYEDMNLAELADKASGLVGREIEQTIAKAMRVSFNAKKGRLDETILGEELRGKPRIIKTMKDEIQEIVDWVGYDPEVDDGIRARLASNKRSETFKTIGGEKA